MYTVKSLKKNHIVFSYNKENFKKICISIPFDFNYQFIKVVGTRPIFQKFQKIYIFCFLLISGVTTLYIFRIFNFFVEVRMVRFYPIR